MPFRWRPDGDYVADVPRVRKIMPFIMRGKNESAAYYEQKIDVTETERFIHAYRERTGHRLTFQHLAVWAVAMMAHRRPRMNRFVAGTRIFQRRGIYVSFSGKKAKHDDAPLITVKRLIEPDWPFHRFVRAVDGDLREARSDKESSVDKELKWFLRLPAWILGNVVRLQMWLDRWGLLPRSFIENDPLYATVFVANLGSVGLQSAYHHLYEYGTISTFMVLGRVNHEPVVDAQGEVVVKPRITVKYTYDERMEDGLYMLGCMEGFRQMMEQPGDYIDLDAEAAYWRQTYSEEDAPAQSA